MPAAVSVQLGRCEHENLTSGKSENGRRERSGDMGERRQKGEGEEEGGRNASVDASSSSSLPREDPSVRGKTGEVGDGKVRFVLAIDEAETIADVTFRYASSWREVLQRRRQQLHAWWNQPGTRALLESPSKRRENERRERQPEGRADAHPRAETQPSLEGDGETSEGSRHGGGVQSASETEAQQGDTDEFIVFDEGPEGSQEPAGPAENVPKESGEAQPEESDPDEVERRLLLEREPLPTSKAGFSKHPKFVLASMLRPSEYLPPGTRPAAFFQGELVYLRRDVSSLKTERQWSREGRRLRAGVTPLRVVFRRNLASQGRQLGEPNSRRGGGSRSQWLNPILQQEGREEERRARREERGTGDGRSVDRVTLGLYGEWQTEGKPPPRVEDGRLPDNGHGNIEVGNLGPVPIGAVHISLADFRCSGCPSLSPAGKQATPLSAASLGGALVAAAAKCGVEFRPAVVAFERKTGSGLAAGSAGWIPVRDGVVVLEADEARVRAAWREEREKREAAWERRRRKKEEREREDGLRKWRVLCRALLFWKEREEDERREKGRSRPEGERV
ncbi:putative DNA repair protein [Neospora caninum Liverpool]|uniref:DNA repair protein, putative n=1 Tax=Neospora caninum (strain Liverpool) TaxID=572307 RepID=F0VCW5_NEOCL|nr:putative DNA repair protein [Neospora caninum Liverpool]CBZ51480.1 putative DNA repair protein [Neospora caninum Liverpool]CEL65430.1 TPA: DNA repair protein, putative [Neospora caninum Liverpool]|eukprot:XP_003881513.1 putative DNA repair protein [Neospora caninum Liverpool]